MWEERSCRQTREWQHWGSGCYRYECTKGRLIILVSVSKSKRNSNQQTIMKFSLFYSQVANYSYECYYAGQNISIKISSGGWLHHGFIQCPPCREICEEQFQAMNTTCKPGEEAPPSNLYPGDVLRCVANYLYIPGLFYIISLQLLYYYTI